jgi:hypothetical protein
VSSTAMVNGVGSTDLNNFSNRLAMFIF